MTPEDRRLHALDRRRGAEPVPRGPRRARDGAVRDQARDRRPGGDARARARGAAGRRPRAARGRPRPGQDADRQDRRRRARRLVQAPAVHARPRAGRPRRHAHLPAGHRRLRHRARPGVLQLPARRRDQPRARQGAVGAARGDAGAPGHDRPRHAPRAGAVPRAGDAEPDRVRGHLPAARGAGRPLHVQARRRLPGAPRRGRGGRALARRRRAARARCSRPEALAEPPARRARRSTSTGA